jgi:hypothetical protein
VTLATPGRRLEGHAKATDCHPAPEQAVKTTNDAVPGLVVVLFTDGGRNTPSDPVPGVERLAVRGVPVHPVLVRSMRRPIDAVVASLEVPDPVT